MASSCFGVGGGGGYTSTVPDVDVNPGQVIPVTVGAGGSRNGGTSSVRGICSANGGYLGSEGIATYVGDKGGYWYEAPGGGSACESNDGGSYIYAGTLLKGQGTTTRYFGESNGTLYSTGGNNFGGSGIIESNSNTGNGGAAGHWYFDFGGPYSKIDRFANNGDSGICIIRWGK